MDDRQGGQPQVTNAPQSLVQLSRFNNDRFNRGRSKWAEALWLIMNTLLVRSAMPGSRHRCVVLRAFGARIGERVTIKPGVRVKFPWRLAIGDDTWIGEDVWIDNLAPVHIGSNCCLSQGAYICTGSHDWSSLQFDLVVKPVMINDCAWIAARSSVGPGVTVGEGAVLSMGSLASKDLAPWKVYRGIPATLVKARDVRAPF